MIPRGTVGLRTLLPVARRSLHASSSVLGEAPSIGEAPAHVDEAPTPQPTDPSAAPTYMGYLAGAISTILAKTAAATQVLGLTSEVDPSEQTKPVVTETSVSGAPTKAQALQRSFEKRVSRTEVTRKTRALVKQILLAESSDSKLTRIQELSSHIISFPPTRIVVAQVSYTYVYRILIANKCDLSVKSL
ncbi:hypothetical protein GCK32_018609 [Trichostrongylus colubriformis]|uniref:Uncharacterized protein n=1 Tax=Trichostrongylus colubriformis TaxID=6319 RepID=A0AAN8IJM5_TRICO